MGLDNIPGEVGDDNDLGVGLGDVHVHVGHIEEGRGLVIV